MLHIPNLRSSSSSSTSSSSSAAILFLTLSYMVAGSTGGGGSPRFFPLVFGVCWPLACLFWVWWLGGAGGAVVGTGGAGPMGCDLGCLVGACGDGCAAAVEFMDKDGLA